MMGTTTRTMVAVFAALIATATASDPRGCHLKMICAAARREIAGDLLEPMRRLPELRRAFTLAWSVPCSTLAPQCPHSDVELVQELVSFPSFEEKHNFAPGEEPGQRAPRPKRETSISAADEYSQAPFQQRRRQRLRVPRRRQLRRQLRRQGGGMPPIFTPEGASSRSVCRTCDRRKTVCTVYSIGSYAGCTGAWLMAGVPGQIACNVATAPGSFGCAMNTLHCFMESCGLVTLPRLP